MVQRRAGGVIRIQRKRTRGWRMPEGALYVGGTSHGGRVGDEAVTRSLAEQYLSFELELHIHMIARRGDSEPSYHCSVFHIEKGPFWRRVDANDPGFLLAGVDIDSAIDHVDLSGVDDTVLVSVRDFSQQGEWFTVRFVPSVVRLQGIDDCDLGFGESLREAAEVGSGVSRPFGDYGKGSSTIVPDVGARKLGNGNIKGRAQIVRGLSQQNTEVEELVGGQVQAVRTPPRLAINILDERVSVRFDENSASLVQGVELLTRSLNFQPRPPEALIHEVDSDDGPS